MNALEYILPENKIAFKPEEKRTNSKLLQYKSGQIEDHQFSFLPKLLEGNYNLILNQTKVVNARIHFKKPSGGKVEVFCLEPFSGDVTTELARTDSVYWKCMVGGAKKWKEGLISAEAEYQGKEIQLNAHKESFTEGVFKLRFHWSDPELTFSEILEIFGKIPLPPYIKREAETTDQIRYQTVFARTEGSVAAPTASLHFTREILEELNSTGVDQIKINLHVGAGTFKPISSSVQDHEMHHELFDVSLEELKRLGQLENFIAVGTTAVRNVESLYLLAQMLKEASVVTLENPQKVNQWDWKTLKDPFRDNREAFLYLADLCTAQGVDRIFGYTSLMIIPGFKFKVIKGLITNFHMPKSTLLFLVAALIGDDWRELYTHALDNEYRFLSYGDSSLLIP